MVQKTLSARQAAAYLGYSTSNPILQAIRDGELPATRQSGGRNGRNTHRFRIERDDLDKLAAARGIQPVVESEPEPEQKSTDSNVASPYELIRELHFPIPVRSARQQLAEPPSTAFTAGVLGVVTIPVEHYAELVTAHGKLEYIEANFELKWHGQWGTDSEHIENLYAEQRQFRDALDRMRHDIDSMRVIVGKRVALENGGKPGGRPRKAPDLNP